MQVVPVSLLHSGDVIASRLRAHAAPTGGGRVWSQTQTLPAMTPWLKRSSRPILPIGCRTAGAESNLAQPASSPPVLVDAKVKDTVEKLRHASEDDTLIRGAAELRKEQSRSRRGASPTQRRPADWLPTGRYQCLDSTIWLCSSTVRLSMRSANSLDVWVSCVFWSSIRVSRAACSDTLR